MSDASEWKDYTCRKEGAINVALRCSCFFGLIVLGGSPLLGKECTAQGCCKCKTEGSRGSMDKTGSNSSVSTSSNTSVTSSSAGSNQIHVYQACLVPSRVNHTAVLAPGTPASDAVTHQTPTMATFSTACMPGLAFGDEREGERNKERERQ